MQVNVMLSMTIKSIMLSAIILNVAAPAFELLPLLKTFAASMTRATWSTKSRDQYYYGFYIRNLCIFLLSLSACPWQVFQA